MRTRLQLYIGAVREFMQTFDQKFYSKVDDTPCEVCKLRGDLINEELKEYTSAPDRLEELDAICDLLYVLVGTGLACNIPMHEWTERPLFGSAKSKVTLGASVTPIIQEMHTLFPCPKRSMHDLNEAIRAVDCAGISRGFVLYDAFVAVHQNNMAKLWDEKPADSKLISVPKVNKFLVRNQSGKIIKPPYHKKVDLTHYI